MRLNTTIDAEFVTYRLEEAGRTLLAMPGSGKPNLGARVADYGVVHEMVEATGFNSGNRIRPEAPSSKAITRMDEAYGWLGMIPDSQRLLRRIVGARSLVSPLTERHLFSWRQLGTVLGADYRAMQRWHGQGIAIIARALEAPVAVVKQAA